MGDHPFDLKDGGLASRKLWFSVGTSCAIFGCAVLAACWPVFGANLQTVVGGLLATLGVYCGVSVTNSWLTGKNVVGHAAAVKAPEEEMSNPGEVC